MKNWIIAFSLTATVAEARLGETPAQLAARFGKPTGSEGGMVFYEKNGFRIAATGWNGVCCEIIYETDQLITEAQIASFLQNNLPAGLSWKKLPMVWDSVLAKVDPVEARKRISQSWISSDHRYSAVMQPTVMTFSDSKLTRERQAAREAARNKATEGF